MGLLEQNKTTVCSPRSKNGGALAMSVKGSRFGSHIEHYFSLSSKIQFI